MKKKLKATWAYLSLTLVTIAVVVLYWNRASIQWRHQVEVEKRPIFQGVTYHVDRFDPINGEEIWAHCIEIDLNDPGIELFLTPHRENTSKETQYILGFVGQQAKDADLDIAVNATFFYTDAPVFYPGDEAGSNETIVSDTRVNHIHDHSYLLWFDEQLTPTMETVKPPSTKVLSQAVWGVAGQQVILNNDKIGPSPDAEPERLTALGINQETNTLWITTFEQASYHSAAAYLRYQGAKLAMPLDSGRSMSLYLSPEADTSNTGTITTQYRPVATIFGIRANVLPNR